MRANSFMCSTISTHSRGCIEDADRALAKLASSYWVNFVATGDPNGPDVPHWPSHRSEGSPVMALDSPHKAGPEEWRERHVFLKAVTEARERRDNYCITCVNKALFSPEPSDSLIATQPLESRETNRKQRLNARRRRRTANHSVKRA